MQTEKKTPEQDAPSISATYAQMAKDRAQAASDAADKPQPSSLAETLKPATAPSVPLPELPPKSLGELTAYLRKEIDDEPARKREESRQRTREMIASIGDMGRALANLGFTSNYAPNAYDHEAHSVTGRMRQRWEKAKADRLANRDRHLNRLMQLYELEQGGADRAYKRKRDAEADKRAAAAEDRAVKEHNLRIPILEGQARKAKADAQKAEVQAEYEAARIISVIGRNNRTGKGKVSASVGRGAGGKKVYTLKVGEKEYIYDTAAEFNAGIMEHSIANHLNLEEVFETDTPTGTTSRLVKKTYPRLAGDLANLGKGSKKTNIQAFFN